MNTVAIIIPTMNNRAYLEPCLQSLLAHTSNVLYRVVVVNNGDPADCDWISFPQVAVSQPGRNLGWEGALQTGLDCTSDPFVLFLNDDVFIPSSGRNWLHSLLSHMDDERVGAVGPSSNYVAGPQSIWNIQPYDTFDARFLIGFCLLVRRTALNAAGGIDATLPGGDDIDLSIRLRNELYVLVGDRTVFVYHHGSKTGERLHGGPHEQGGWNSYQMTTNTFTALSTKHGQAAVEYTWLATPLGAHPSMKLLVDLGAFHARRGI